MVGRWVHKNEGLRLMGKLRYVTMNWRFPLPGEWKRDERLYSWETGKQILVGVVPLFISRVLPKKKG